MKLFFAFLLLPFTAQAASLDVEATTGIYYFSADSAQLRAAETEKADSVLTFQSPRDSRVVARELAQTEIQHGNICLTQARQDLAAALKSKQIVSLCHKLYKDDLPAAVRAAEEKRLKADFFRCSANVEAREGHAGLRMVLSFHASVVMQKKVSESLEQAGFPRSEKTYPLPVREAALGEAAHGWKGVLENGSCALNEASLNTFLDRYLAGIGEIKALNRCRVSQARLADGLVRLQKQFKDYVPEAWLRELGEDKMHALLTPPAAVDSVASLKECRAEHTATAEQWEKLQKIGERIADKHDVPALDPKNQAGARALASEVESEE